MAKRWKAPLYLTFLGNNEIAKPIDMMAENAKFSIFCFDKELFDIVDCQLTIWL